jgi:hypothetical protein
MDGLRHIGSEVNVEAVASAKLDVSANYQNYFYCQTQPSSLYIHFIPSFVNWFNSFYFPSFLNLFAVANLDKLC